MKRKSPRARAAEALIYLALLAAVVFLCLNALANLEARGINSGFDFLGNTAGFDVGFQLISFDSTNSFARAFLVGLLNTLAVSVVALVLATLLGLVVALARMARSPALAGLARVYVELVRNCPLLLQIFAWYFLLLAPLPSPKGSLSLGGGILLNNRGLYLPTARFDGPALAALGLLALAVVALPILRARRRRREGRVPHPGGARRGLLIALGLGGLALFAVLRLEWELPALKGFNLVGGAALVPEFIALALALAVYGSAFIAEIFRASIQAVDGGQGEAALALGLTRWQSLRLVVLPLAMRSSLPPLTNQYVNIFKYSSLAAAIAYPDLMLIFAKTTLNQTGQAIEVIGITMSVYLAISLATAALMRRYEARVALVKR